MAYGSVTVNSNTSIALIAANTKRHSLLITNLGASVVFIGSDSSVTTATGIALVSGANLTEDASGTGIWGGAFYGIAGGGIATVRVWERVR